MLFSLIKIVQYHKLASSDNNDINNGKQTKKHNVLCDYFLSRCWQKHIIIGLNFVMDL